MKTNHNKELGKLGEEIAAKHLQSLGMVIAEQNWHKRGKELDIIAIDKATLRIVEVKSRTKENIESIHDSLNPKKLQSLTKAAAYYCSTYFLEGIEDVYFDLITLIFDEDGSYELEYTPEFFHPSW